MLEFLEARTTYRETTGPGSFEPSHPDPSTKPLNVVQLLRGARKDFLGIWSAREYIPRTTAKRVLGRQITLVNEPDTVKRVMATNHDNYERKTPQMRRSLEGLIGDGLFISDGEVWKQRRPLVVDIVHKHRLPVYGRVMEAACAELLEDWSGKPAGEILNAHVEMAELTATIIARSVFGNDLRPDQAATVVDGFGTYQRDVDMVNMTYFLGKDEGSPIRRTKTIKSATEKVQGVIADVVAAHLAGAGDGQSMIDSLVKVQEKNPHAGLTVDAIRNEAATIFMAGYETTAGTLTWALYCLSKSPWAEEKMLAEIERVCGDREIRVEDVPELDYCRSVIDETLRLYPPVPILGRQARDADQLGKVAIEPASLVLVVPWLLHRTAEFWPKPHHFKPERFIEGRTVPYTYVPFAAGPRICAGLAFGQTEATLCLAMIVRRFRIRTAGDQRIDPICRLTLRPRDGLSIVIERR